MKDGSLRLVQELPLSSEAGDYGAEITFDETGDTLYASSRGTGVIIVYRLNSSSSPPTLERIQEISQSGSWPRHFVLQDRLLVTTDQKGDSLQVLHVEPSTGLLIPGKIAATEHSPAFVTFINWNQNKIIHQKFLQFVSIFLVHNVSRRKIYLPYFHSEFHC